MKLRAIILCAAALLTAVWPHGAIAERFPRIVHGTAIPEAGSSVAKVVKTRRDRPGTVLCSGVFLTPNVVLTASHCAAVDAAHIAVAALGRRYRVIRQLVHPSAHPLRDGRIENDVALLFLSRPAPVDAVPLLVSRVPQPADTVTFLGFGADASGHVGSLHSGSGTLLAVNGAFISSRYHGTDSDTCTGDSGGPLFVDFESDGKDVLGLVGITSTGTSESCAIGDVTSYPRLAAPVILRFIEKHVHGLLLS